MTQTTCWLWGDYANAHLLYNTPSIANEGWVVPEEHIKGGSTSPVIPGRLQVEPGNHGAICKVMRRWKYSAMGPGLSLRDSRDDNCYD